MYVDLSIRPRDLDELKAMVKVMVRFRVRAAAMEYGIVDHWEAKSIASKAGVKLSLRATIKASTRREARLKLDRITSEAPEVEIVALEPLGLDAARYAAANRRVDVIRVEPGMERIVDRGEARIIEARGSGVIEVSMRHLLADRPPLRFYITVFRRAYAYNIPLAVSSDASDIYSLWEPRSTASLIASLGVPYQAALRWISSIPSRALRGE